ncbi:hypothetical protein Tdes44962_MAKER08808 [Teratosphaeria destructans]|uniref:Alpha/beta hydrolase fold-3 domain-containing protein n=1 Tax=Teratosphaeria destructans TaxID=418781 RepID=A0A9W7SVJ0_9PEZI|nr:hypothetical protein Tdes44962_MAKER08808 [Teratosphaeria destructans]
MTAPLEEASSQWQHPKPPRSRWMLHLQATVWRFLMGLGMLFHKLAPPRPPKPNFQRQIPSTIAGKPGMILLQFYVPKDYETQRRLWKNRPRFGWDGPGDEEEGEVEEEDDRRKSKTMNRRVSATFSMIGDNIRRRSMSARRWGGYPVVINFHGGGFTLGTATDDARWCGTVVDECHAIVVSVEYRKAPEMPFPTAVEDGVDAVLWIHEHADDLGIDREKIALSGFSSGGNMAFTVPLRLYDEQTGFLREEATASKTDNKPNRKLEGIESVGNSTIDLPNGNVDGVAESNGQPPGSTTHLAPGSNPEAGSSTAHLVPTNTLGPVDSTARLVPSRDNDDNISPPSTAQPSPAKRPQTTITERKPSSALPDVKIRCIVPWYPSLDYTRTREQRRATTVRKDHELPAIFTDLFDESYLHPPQAISLDSPYLSPGVAPTALLKNALPDEIIMHTCEWDMLLDEGQEFYRRLTSEPLHKKVWYTMVENVPHGWDKAPNPWKPTPGVREHYLRACKEMRRVFGPQPGLVERRTSKGASAAARESVQVVR